MFVGLPAYLQRRLQTVQRCVKEAVHVDNLAVYFKYSAAACLVFSLRRYDHVSDALAILHWLRLPERVNFKLALIPYRVLNGMAP